MSPVRYLSIFACCLALLLLPSCEDDPDCSAVLPPPNWFELGFFTADGEPLIGTVYQQDTFRMYNDDTELSLGPVPFGDTTRLQIRFDDILSDTAYFIELNEEDTDTLMFSYEVRQGPCFRFAVLQESRHNGEIVPQNSSYVVDIVK